ncbi:hypothetical protein [Methylobacterium sp. CM6257]
MIDLEELHRMLDIIEAQIDHLSGVDAEYVDVNQVGDLCGVLIELLDYTSIYESPILGLNRTTLTRYVKFRGPYPTSEARYIAQRTRSFLRSLDHATDPHRPPVRPNEDVPRLPEKSAQEGLQTLDIAAEGWRYVGPSSELKAKITALSSLLDSIILRVEGSNMPPDQQALTQLERNQLIAMLETALAVLKAPMLERGLLKRLRKTLGNTAAKAAETEAEQGLGKLAELAGQWIGDLISSLWSSGGS